MGKSASPTGCEYLAVINRPRAETDTTACPARLQVGSRASNPRCRSQQKPRPMPPFSERSSAGCRLFLAARWTGYIPPGTLTSIKPLHYIGDTFRCLILRSGLKGNPVKIRNCPAAVSRYESRNDTGPSAWEVRRVGSSLQSPKTCLGDIR